MGLLSAVAGGLTGMVSARSQPSSDLVSSAARQIRRDVLMAVTGMQDPL